MALLAACAPVPDLGAAPRPLAAGSIMATQSFAAGETAWPQAGWWQAYGDAQLSALIDEGLKGAPDLAAAAARLRKADALAQQAGAALLPSLDASASGGWAKQSYNNGIPPAFVPRGWQDNGRAALDLGLDLDLWGRNRAALRAATSDAAAARIELEEARLVLSTNIAAAYADLARLFAERDVQQSALRVRSETLALVANRVATGLDTQAELKQAEAAVPAARADVAATDEAIALTRNRLAALIGAGPDRGLTIERPATPALGGRGLPPGVTTDLIGRRPDVAAARARVEAAAARIKVARADFYPAVNLSAMIGLQSLGIDNLVKSGSSIGSVGPAISLPIFHGGELAGRYKGARADYDQAVASYDGSVVEAYHQVADAVTSQRSLAVRLDETRRALASSEQAYAVARQRYEGGLSTFLDVLSAEDAVLLNRRIVADLEARAFTLDVALVRALGGGFATNDIIAKENDDG
ncbi:Multidrug resistance outer membrane protein MdtP precursor [Sphingomonas haloaromaticamans]|uniref:Multidrug resistance outer membrane protein MdtP n=2 Tax=Edaphosphingomonas haloaromaticamans TaxID=653954 RepID=A0A1S1HA80_9SPHN|nr:Multidrug resistance outer membrane protein MdtP precursor [Sphingomonas haloaromaticamans]